MYDISNSQNSDQIHDVNDGDDEFVVPLKSLLKNPKAHNSKLHGAIFMKLESKTNFIGTIDY